MHKLVNGYAGVKHTDLDLPKTLTEVGPHSTSDPLFEQLLAEALAEHRGVCCGVIDKSNIGGFVIYVFVFLDESEERVNRVMCLSVRPGTNLIVCKGIIGFRIHGEPCDKESFKELCERTNKENGAVGRWAVAVLFSPFKDRLDKALLPNFGLTVMVPNGIEHHKQGLFEFGTSCSEHAICDAIRAWGLIGG